MRKDMSRVIVERPRLDDGLTRKGKIRDFETLPAKEAMRPRRFSKALNENLGPLRRYLERQVGRPWAKIYSEISQHLRADNTVQQHVRDHLKDFVAITPRREVRRASDLWMSEPWRQPLYVDPKDGILKRTDHLPEIKARKRRPRPEPWPVDEILLSPDCTLRRIEGFWYAFEKVPRPGSWTYLGEERPLYCVIKRSLSRAELRRHGLRNSPDGD